jgi:hypothetical protein
MKLPFLLGVGSGYSTVDLLMLVQNICNIFDIYTHLSPKNMVRHNGKVGIADSEIARGIYRGASIRIAVYEHTAAPLY